MYLFIYGVIHSVIRVTNIASSRTSGVIPPLPLQSNAPHSGIENAGGYTTQRLNVWDGSTSARLLANILDSQGAAGISKLPPKHRVTMTFAVNKPVLPMKSTATTTKGGKKAATAAAEAAVAAASSSSSSADVGGKCSGAAAPSASTAASAGAASVALKAAAAAKRKRATAAAAAAATTTAPPPTSTSSGALQGGGIHALPPPRPRAQQTSTCDTDEGAQLQPAPSGKRSKKNPAAATVSTSAADAAAAATVAAASNSTSMIELDQGGAETEDEIDIMSCSGSDGEAELGFTQRRPTVANTRKPQHRAAAASSSAAAAAAAAKPSSASSTSAAAAAAAASSGAHRSSPSSSSSSALLIIEDDDDEEEERGVVYNSLHDDDEGDDDEVEEVVDAEAGPTSTSSRLLAGLPRLPGTSATTTVTSTLGTKLKTADHYHPMSQSVPDVLNYDDELEGDDAGASLPPPTLPPSVAGAVRLQLRCAVAALLEGIAADERTRLVAAGLHGEAAAVKTANDQHFLSDRSLEFIVRTLPMTTPVSRS